MWIFTTLISAILAVSVAEDDLVVKVVSARQDCTEELGAQNGDILHIMYTGRYDNEKGELFDSNTERGGGPYIFELGAGQVIMGYERGMLGMCEGERRQLTMPPHLAYGEEGYPGIIGPRSTLHFTVDLVKLERKTQGTKEEF